jgi:hypothetical protein
MFDQIKTCLPFIANLARRVYPSYGIKNDLAPRYLNIVKLVKMSKIDSQVPPPAPPEPKPGKQPIPQGPIKQTQVILKLESKIRNCYVKK